MGCLRLFEVEKGHFLDDLTKNGHKFVISYQLFEECNLIETKYAIMIVHPFDKCIFFSIHDFEWMFEWRL